jgi:hypothetical protein
MAVTSASKKPSFGPSASTAATATPPSKNQVAKSDQKAVISRAAAQLKDGFDQTQVKRSTQAQAQAETAPSAHFAAKQLSKADASQATPPPRQTLTAEEAAKKEVQIQTVSTTQKETEEAREKLHEATNSQVNDLFDIAAGKKERPADTEVKQVSENQAELVRKNKEGEIIERTIATRQPDGSVLVDSANFEGGRNTRDRIEANADGSTFAQHAEWPGDNETEKLTNFGDIDRSKNPDLVYTSQRVDHNPEGHLQIEKYSQAGGAVSGSKTSYHQEGLNIDDKLEGDFDRGKPVDTEETYSYSIPAPGPDGSQPTPQYQRIERFSQDPGKSGPIQATAVTNRELNDQKELAGEGPHTRLELDAVRDAYVRGDAFDPGERYDADDAYETGQTPKQWLLEKKTSENSLDTQTFLEGQPRVTTTTHTEVAGDTVTQRTKGFALKPDGKGDIVPVEAVGKTLYAQDGSIKFSASERLEADGTHAIDAYENQREVTDKGLKVNDRMVSVRTTPDGKTTKADQRSESLLSGEGVQLVRANNTTTGPDGSSATTEVDDKGSRLSVTGPGGSDPHEVRTPEELPNDVVKDLAINSVVAVNQEIADYAANGGANALKLVQGGTTPNAAGQVFVSDRLTQPFGGSEAVAKTAQGLKGLGTGVAGGAGVAAGIAGLVDGIKSGNASTIARGVFDTIGGAANLYETGATFKNLFQGKTDLQGAGKWVGGAAAANAPPSATGTTSTISKIGGALKGLGGATTVIGAAVGVATGAIDIAEGVKGGHTGQIARGAIGIVGAVGGTVAALVAASAFGGPVGVAVGALVGGITLVGQKIAEAIADDQHQIAQQSI